MTVLAVIPARKGSKRLPGKNMMELGGYPLIHYSIMHARYSKLINYFVVSTDSGEVKKYCKALRVDCIDRPAELCTDDAKMEDVIIHTLKTCNIKIDKVVLLQPTSPLRTIDDIDACIELSRYGSVVSVAKGCINGFFFRKNGAVYVWDCARIIDGKFDYDICYIMPYERSIDIDTAEDFEEAKRILNEKDRL